VSLQTPRSDVFVTTFRILALALAYFVTGKLGLLMAIPPGYATVVWPPSGIALAAILLYGARLWPGVVIGSFAVNIATSFNPDPGGWVTAKSALIPLAIGGGAALQSLFGAFLVRRAVGSPLELVREREVIKFFLLAGPLGCLLNSTVGTSTLLLTESIQPEQVAFTWWTWWVGDTIGVGVATPLLLILLAEPRDVWRRRRSAAGIPLVCVFALTVALFIWANAAEQARIRAEFERHTQKAVLSVQAKLDNAVHQVQSLSDFYTAVPDVDPATFSTFALRTLELNPGIQALSWNPRVAGGNREDFERRARESGYGGYRIVERNEEGRLVPAAPRDEHVVVLHIEPHEANAAAAGYDLASEGVRRDALRRACDTGQPAATGLLHLIQEKTGKRGLLIFAPVYSAGPVPVDSESRRQKLRGFAIGVLRLDQVLGAALEHHADPDVRIAVRDDSAAGPDRLLWSDGPGAFDPAPVAPEMGGLLRSGRLTFGGRNWSVLALATPAYTVTAQTWRPWITLSGGMLFMGVLAAFLLMVTGKAVLIERLGAERAAELSAANVTLQREMEIRKRAQEELQRKEVELRQAQKMEAIGRLAGGIAHDFNNLLTAILGYGNLLELKMEPGDPSRGDVEEILNAGKRATDLTRQLLAFSRRQVLVPKVLDLNAVVFDVVKILKRLIGEHIELVTRVQPGLGRVMADPSQVEQVIMNLAINARDAMSKGGTLTIETQDVYLDESYPQIHPEVLPGPYVMLTVSDTGAGMDPETQAMIFEPFFTTKERGKGTGLGLSTVYGIVRQSDGYIRVYSEPGRGSTFKVYLPRADKGAETHKSAIIADAPKGGSESILVVEDEAPVRKLLCNVLRTRGYKVAEAGNGAEALETKQKTPAPIQLLITDLVMPGIGGRELAEQMTGAQPGLKVLYVSGYTEDAVMRKGELGVGSAFLSKPFTPETLLRQVRTLLDHK
jgi:signal transduction histidine kinase/CheY-like chemotaxis protein